MIASHPVTRRAFLLGAASIALLAGCSAQEEADQAANEGSAPAGNGSAAEQEPAADAAAGGRVLVAYYSAQGHTEAVAQTIADELGADLFEITPTEPYTDADLNWNDAESRVSREHDDESLRDVPLEQVTPDGWEGYGTVYLGYPIWWGIAAWPVDGFVAGNDWDGKTVIPFCTSASSSLGRSGELLAQEAGTGDWQEGMRFSSGADEDEVRAWASDAA